MLFAGTPFLMLARRLMYRCCEAGVAAATATTAGYDETLIGLGELEQLVAGFVVEHDRSDRNFQDDAFAVASGLVRAFAVTPALRGVFGIEAEVHQRIVALARFHDDVAALAAIASGRSTARNELLAAEGHAAIAAVSGFDPNFRLINKHCRSTAALADPRNLGGYRFWIYHEGHEGPRRETACLQTPEIKKPRLDGEAV